MKRTGFPIYFKVILVLIGFMAAAYLLLNVGLPMYMDIQAGDSPVVQIEAKNNEEYTAAQTMNKDDFTVKAVHENGQKTILGSDEFTLSRKDPQPYGAYTKVTVFLKEDKDISDTLKVKNVRKEKEVFPCGSPNQEQVKAVLYSNGELAFEGKGNIAQYESGAFPWQNSENAETIKYVTFQKGVKATSLDYFFSDMANLTYVSSLPDSVTSMAHTFSGCVSLENAPDWSSCHSLLDISGCYEECEALVNVPSVPQSVRTMTSAFSGCTAMQYAPDMSRAESVKNAESAFSGCALLAKVALPPSVENINGIFSGCINLKSMPEIPETVTSMNTAFEGDVSLSKLTVIPANVTDVSACFSGCTKISGILWVDGNPAELSGCFEGAAAATEVDLQGNSKLMDALANTGTNITVDGNPPNPEIQSYDDIFVD